MGSMEWVLIIAALVTGLVIGWGIMAAKLMQARQGMVGAINRLDYDVLMEEKITLATRLDTTLGALDLAQQERTAFHERALTAEARNKALEKQMQEQQEQLKLEFQNTANKIFEQVTAKFSTQSEKQLGDLLQPFRDRLGDFQKLVTDSFTAHGKEQHTLKNEIEKIVLQTDSLTKALRGDVKAQGNWGEVILERILEESGLQKGIAYVVQGVEMGLSSADGSRQKPDVIINLPDSKHIIIDSKVSLTAYERFCSGSEESDTHLRDFLRSIKAHVNGLEQRRYQDNEKLGTPDFVLMFMPIEGAYSLAVQCDPELHSYAWGKRVVIVSPSILFPTLQTIASLWRIESQNRNTQEIARQAGALYDKFVGFVEDMIKIGDKMNGLQKNYDEAMNKLKTGTGNLISRTEKLKQLGVKPSKPMPREMITADAETPEASVPLLVTG